MSSSKWARLREAVMRRDGYLCQECKRNGRLKEAKEVDHIIPLHLDGTDSPDNLESICSPCHAQKTAREAAEARKG